LDLRDARLAARLLEEDMSPGDPPQTVTVYRALDLLVRIRRHTIAARSHLEPAEEAKPATVAEPAE
jgi:hypothetical protein